MKSRKSVPSLAIRAVFWTAMVGSLAVASSSWPFGLHGTQVQPKRKSTDAPVAAKGKLGQDLFLAIDHRSLEAVQDLLKKGADPNARNGLEFTPLFIAAASHQTDVMKALLDAGAKLDADSTYGTALSFAALGGNVEGASLLISKGADVDVTRGDGSSVLMMASVSGATPIVAELIQKKADVNAANDDGATALSLAARQGHIDIGRKLIDAGAKVNTADAEQQTPLMEAAKNGHTEFVKLLLQKGAKPNARDLKGRTALLLAAAYGDYPGVVRALVAGGADPKAADKTGMRAADIAAARLHKGTVAALGGARSASASTKLRTPQEAVNLSLKLIQYSTNKFDQMTSCVSCHQEGLGRMATGSAARHGLKLDPATQKAQMDRINGALAAMKPLHEAALKDPEMMKQVPLIEINEVNTIDGWLLSGMAAHNQPPNEATAAMAMVLARQQNPAGFWSFSLPRVPMQSSFVTFTALAVHSLQAYGPKANASEVQERIGRARTWLLQAPIRTNEDMAFRLLGLKWSGADAESIQKAVDEVRSGQLPDGGWSQMPDLQSDAYATGQALYALHVAGGMPVTDPVYKAGVAFLLRTQDPDGSWFVNKRAMPANNYLDAGFPHGESQYSSFNGTCWATLALLETFGSSPKR